MELQLCGLNKLETSITIMPITPFQLFTGIYTLIQTYKKYQLRKRENVYFTNLFISYGGDMEYYPEFWIHPSKHTLMNPAKKLPPSIPKQLVSLAPFLIWNKFPLRSKTSDMCGRWKDGRWWIMESQLSKPYYCSGRWVGWYL